MTRYFSFEQKIRSGKSTQMASTGNCTGAFKLPLQDPTWPYYRNLGNNNVFLVQTKQGDCSTRDAQIMVGNINNLDTDVYAYWLAVGMNDTANTPKPLSYIMTCTVDTRSVFDYREVSLLLQNRDAAQTRYMRLLNVTDQVCDGPSINRDLIATAASANWQTFLQQASSDGWFDLVWETCNNACRLTATLRFPRVQKPP